MPVIGEKNGVKNLKYDFTYVEETDSVSYLSTLRTQQFEVPDSVAIHYCGQEYISKAEIIYITPKGKLMECRVRAMLPFDVWHGMYQCATPYVVEYRFNKSGRCFVFGIRPNKWKNESQAVSSIMNIIKLNTER